MSELEQGIELTLKVLMKVKDDEIAALCDEINDHDTEVEKLKKEIELLKAENKQVKRQRDIMKTYLWSRVDDVKMELKDMKSYHQEEMKNKCEQDLNQLDRKHKQSLNAFDLWILYCNKVFNFKNLKVERYEESEKMKLQLELKIKKMSEHQEAFLTLAKDKHFVGESIRLFKDELQNLNISVLQDILRRFGCDAAMVSTRYFLIFLDEDGQRRTYRDVGMNDSYDHPSIDLYDYEFKVCDYCNGDFDDGPHTDGLHTCCYTHKGVVFQPLGL